MGVNEVRRLLAAAACASILAMAGCGEVGVSKTRTAQDTSNQPASASQLPFPERVAECIFPDTSGALAPMVRAADVVVARVVLSGAPIYRASPAGPLSSYPASITKVVRANRPIAPDVYLSGETSNSTPYQDSEYVMFLYTYFSPGEHASGFDRELWLPDGGLLGMFPVRNGLVFRECSDPTAPTGRRQAVGSMPVLAFESLIAGL